MERAMKNAYGRRLSRALRKASWATKSVIEASFGRPGKGRRARDEFRQELERVRGDLEQRIFRLEMLTTRPALDVPRRDAVRVSVVLPTRNRAALLERAIASVTGQVLADWELLIIDDRSRDGTPDIIARAAADPRVRGFRNDLEGRQVGSLRNQMVREARGEFVSYLDDDNTYYPHFLAAAVQTLETNPAVDLVYGALVHDDPPRPASPIMWEPFDRPTLLRRNYIDTSTMVHRRHLHERLGGWNEELSSFEDWDLALRYTRHAPAMPVAVLAARYTALDIPRISTSDGRRQAYSLFRTLWPAD